MYDIIHKELMRGVSCKTHVNWVGNYRAYIIMMVFKLNWTNVGHAGNLL